MPEILQAKQSHMTREEKQTELLESITNRATSLWGKERTDALQLPISHTVDALMQIARDLPESGEEPAFFW